jgi:hypothetical protein
MKAFADPSPVKVIAIIVWLAVAVGNTTAQSPAKVRDTLSTGDSSPEGAAGDLIRAYISRDERLFHARRCKLACEGKLDPVIAYRAFLKHTPELLDDPKRKNADSARPIRILRIMSVDQSDVSENDKEIKRLGLLWEFGAIETKCFDVITVADTGQHLRTRVEALHIGKFGDGGLLKLLPTGTWRARILHASPTTNEE